MKRLTVFFATFFIIAVLAVDGCTPSPSPIATPEVPTPTPAPPTATAVPPTPTMAPPTPTQLPPTPTAVPQVRTLQVSSTADSGPGTLRQALLDAGPGDNIAFDPTIFPPSAPATISLSEGLPEITQGNLTVDASNAGVILDGSAMTGSQHGLSISSDGNTIRGLQVVGFSDAGIALYGGAQHNVIGGDRGIGDGPLGQGNLISGNGNFGIGLWDEGTSNNIIQGNYIGINLEGTEAWGHPRDGIHSNGANGNVISDNVIGGNDTGVYLCCVVEGRNALTNNVIGTDLSGAYRLGNHLAGVLVDRTSYNVIGPGNTIAYNDGQGVMFWEDTPNNTVTENSIHDNGELGISLNTSGPARMPAPVIFDFDLEAGRLAGLACAYCVVEAFSDSGDEGATYEGQTVADESGVFELRKAAALIGPQLTTTATDPDGSTSGFSRPTAGTRRSLTLQEGNNRPGVLLEAKCSAELADNRTGGSFHGSWLQENYANALTTMTDLGLKRVDVVYGEIEPPIDWNIPEYDIPLEFDSLIDDLAANGVAVNYVLHYWDKAGHAAGVELSTPRFAGQEQVQDYLDYVRFMVRHFRGRIQYYTIWSEPDNCIPPPIKCIRPLDYINLARQTIPVIRQEDPQAKVVLAPVVLYFARDYLFTLLGSDVVPLFDVISWHPMYDAAPDIAFFGNYYYEYPSIVQRIRQMASANGFEGEYWGTELTWRISGLSPANPDQPWETHTHIQSAKYWARGIVMQLGMDVGVGLGGPGPDADVAYRTVRNVNTIMAGARPVGLSAEVETETTNIMSYGFVLPNGSMLFAIWTDRAAVDDALGVPATLSFREVTAQGAVAIDVLNGFEQELITETKNGHLVIPNLLIMDYPIILRLVP